MYINKLLFASLIGIVCLCCVAAHSDEYEVIDLGSFGLADGDDITDVLITIAKEYAPKVSVKLPSGITELKSRYIDFSDYNVRDFFLYEPSTPLRIKQVAEGDKKNILFRFENYDRIYIGGPKHNITFVGTHKGIKGGHNSKLWGVKGEGLLHFNYDQEPDGHFLSFHANVRDSRVFGIRHNGAHKKRIVERVTISGKFENSGISMNSGYQHLHLDDVWITDPYGVTLGWDGTDKKKNNAWHSLPIHWEIARGLIITYAEKITGGAILEYGLPSWFISTVPQIGESEEEPFRIGYKDIGYAPDGTKISSHGFLDTGGKVDSLGPNPNDLPRFVKFYELDHQFGFGPRHSVILEATSEDGDNGYLYKNEGLNIELEDISCPVKLAHIDYLGDYSGGHRVTGSMVSHPNHCSGKPSYIEVLEDNKIFGLSAFEIRLKPITKVDKYSRNNEFTEITILSEGSVIVFPGSENNRFDDLVFEGQARSVFEIRNGRNPSLPVSVDLKNVVAPDGSTIVADSIEHVSVTLDGEKLHLPYKFGDDRL